MLVTDSIDKTLTKAIGRCYHEWIHADGWLSKGDQCTLCTQYRDEVISERVDFSTWEGFGILLEWAKKQSWWYTFIGISQDGLAHDDWEALAIELVNPSAFAIAIYEELHKE